MASNEPQLATAVAPQEARPPRHRRSFLWEALENVLRRMLDRYNRAVACRSVHGDRTFFDPAQFPWIREVEAGWREVRRELDDVLARETIPQFKDISPDQSHLTADGKWKTFFFCAYGVRVEENSRRCPGTARILKKIPGLQTAFFSILEPDMHIHPHRGPYGGVLRLHLALMVPEPRAACRIRVDREFATWEEGKCLVFDDTYEHEVWNDTAGERVILFVDFERPLPRHLRAVNRLFIRLIALSPLVQDGIKRYEEWTRQHPLPR